MNNDQHTQKGAVACTVYRCSRERDMYIYVQSCEGLERLPAELLQAAGTLTEVLQLSISPDRKLARARAPDVLAAIGVQGYYLQLPPDKQLRQFTLGG